MTDASQIKLKNTLDRIAGAILSGKNLNPPPTRKIKYPCIICNRPVQSNQKAIECDTCEKWCHLNCDGRVSTPEYEFFQNDRGGVRQKFAEGMLIWWVPKRPNCEFFPWCIKEKF